MKRFILIIITLTTVSMLLASEQHQKASDFLLEDAQGNLIKLSELNDKPVLIDFWAMWCVPCKKALPHLSELQEKYPEKLTVLAINIDKPRMQAKAAAYVKSNNYQFTTLYDPESITMKLFNVVNPPRTILIAPGMNIVYTHDGYKRGDEIEIGEMVEKWIDWKPDLKDKSKKIVNTDFRVNGMNKLKYVYRTAEDSLHHFLDNELSFAAAYHKFRFGMTYRGELPEYDKFAPDENLESRNIYHEWIERFAEYKDEHFFLRAGNFETVFGSGMAIHAYNNTDMNEDLRLDGTLMQVKYDFLRLQGIYGSLPSENYPAYDDIVTGLDATINLFDFFSIGGSTLSYRTYVFEDKYDYNQRNVFDGRLAIKTDLVELNSEYAESKLKEDLIDDINGSALYANMNLYLGKFRITAAYKDYENFNERLVELPTVNHCEEPIAEYGQWSDPGFDEKGVQGIIYWTPNDGNELELNYAEGWASEEDVFQSDFYGSYKREFNNWSLHLEYTQMERLDDSSEEYKWDKETKPSLESDFMIIDKPILVKFEWKYQQYDNYGNETGYNEPLFQIDYGFYENYSISLITSMKYKIDGKLNDAEKKLGVELSAPVWNHTDIRLFAGSEKGGKVCRNGVCNYQAPFDGIRLEVTTRF